MQSWTSTERWFLRDVIAPLVTWNTDFRTLPEKRKLFPPTQAEDLPAGCTSQLAFLANRSPPCRPQKDAAIGFFTGSGWATCQGQPVAQGGIGNGPHGTQERQTLRRRSPKVGEWVAAELGEVNGEPFDAVRAALTRETVQRLLVMIRERIVRVFTCPSPPSKAEGEPMQRCAHNGDFSLHAGLRSEANDRDDLEHRLHDWACPTVAPERLRQVDAEQRVMDPNTGARRAHQPNPDAAGTHGSPRHLAATIPAARAPGQQWVGTEFVAAIGGHGAGAGAGTQARTGRG